MAASPYDYSTIVEHEINDPASFLPTTLCYQGNNLLWTKPAYATYNGTPIIREIINSSFLCNEEKVALPLYMERISKSELITEHQSDYIIEYKLAAATFDHWCHHKHDDDQPIIEAIKSWRSTCDKLTQNPHYSTGWDLSAFYPRLLSVYGWNARFFRHLQKSTTPKK
jgi:hypothetical protein